MEQTAKLDDLAVKDAASSSQDGSPLDAVALAQDEAKTLKEALNEYKDKLI